MERTAEGVRVELLGKPGHHAGASFDLKKEE
jgi:hypothetical protein